VTSLISVKDKLNTKLRVITHTYLSELQAALACKVNDANASVFQTAS